MSRLLYLHFNWAAWPWNFMWWNFFPSILNSLFFEKIHEPNILFFDFSLGSLCYCIRLACELLWSDLGLCKFINALHFKCIVVFNLKFIFFQPQSLKNWGYTPFFSLSAFPRKPALSLNWISKIVALTRKSYCSYHQWIVLDSELLGKKYMFVLWRF